MEMLYLVGNVFRSVVFDATLKELHGSSLTVTTHRVEKGVNVADHVQEESDRLSVEVHVSNTPILALGVDGADGAVQPLQLTDGGRILTDGARVAQSGAVTLAAWETASVGRQANVLQFPKVFDRVRAVYEQLLALKGVELTIITPIRQYDSMVYHDLSLPRDSASSSAVTISLELVEMRFAETQTVAAPKPVQTRGKKPNNKGAQATEVADKDKTSLGAKLVERFAGINLGTTGRAR